MATAAPMARMCAVRARGALLAAARRLRAGQHATCAPPPPKVTVAVPVQRTVTRYLEATGNTAAVNSADLVARVQGFLQEINYKDGDLVKKGTTLFTIEPEPYKLKLEQAQAAEAGRAGDADAGRGRLRAPGRSRQPPGRLPGDARQRSTAKRDGAKAKLAAGAGRYRDRRRSISATPR